MPKEIWPWQPRGAELQAELGSFTDRGEERGGVRRRMGSESLLRTHRLLTRKGEKGMGQERYKSIRER